MSAAHWIVTSLRPVTFLWNACWWRLKYSWQWPAYDTFHGSVVANKTIWSRPQLENKPCFYDGIFIGAGITVRVTVWDEVMRHGCILWFLPIVHSSIVLNIPWLGKHCWALFIKQSVWLNVETEPTNPPECKPTATIIHLYIFIVSIWKYLDLNIRYISFFKVWCANFEYGRVFWRRFRGNNDCLGRKWRRNNAIYT